jgi:malate dehydrogenase
VAQVKNVAIWGNHSSTQYPDFYHATVAGKPAIDAIRDERWLQTEFIETVQKRGAAIIKARGHSSAASAANAVVDAVRNLTTPTKGGEFFSMAVSSDGSYGVDEGLMFSFPVRSDGSNWEIVQGIEHNEFAKEKIQNTLAELRAERDAVKDLLPVLR